MEKAETKEEFIKEVKSNNYVEYLLDGEDAVLISDVESGGVFNPYIVTSKKYDKNDKQQIDDLLNSEEIINYSRVQYDKTNSQNQKGSIFHVEGSSVPDNI